MSSVISIQDTSVTGQDRHLAIGNWCCAMHGHCLCTGWQNWQVDIQSQVYFWI